MITGALIYGILSIDNSMKTKILILGSTGMLGSMMYRYFSRSTPYRVIGTVRDKKNQDANMKHFDAQQFLHHPKEFSFILSFDYIINCIGVIKPHCQDTNPVGVRNAIEVNALFPHALADYCQNTPARVLQIATDCVYSGSHGHYTEKSPHDALDVYGKTKSLGEVNAPNILHIRSSIIGPEQKTSYSLLAWFLNQSEGKTLQGYTHHTWNGVTTLQFARICQKIIYDNAFHKLRKTSHVYHFVPNTAVTKYELLQLFNTVFHKKMEIKAVSDAKNVVDRTLATKYPSFTSLYGKKTMTEALQELQLYEKI